MDRLRKRSHLLPREAKVFLTGHPTSGEHEFASYHEQPEEHQQALDPGRKNATPKRFFDSRTEYIEDVWRLPSNAEILNLPVNGDDIRAMNPIQQAPTAEDIAASTNIAQHLLRLLPTFTQTNDSDTMVRNKGRLVHFTEAFNYECLAFKYLKYWRAASDIFDLEYFVNKLSTTAFTIATVERSILSGLPFWDLLNEVEEQSESSSSEEEVVAEPE